MSRADKRVMVAVTQMLLQTGAALGVDRAELLATAGLDEQDIADRDRYIPLAKQVAIGAELGRRLPGVNVGLAALEHFQSATFGVLGYVISHSQDLRAALQAFIRFQTLVSDAVVWQLDRASDAPRTRITIEVAREFEQLAFPVETQVGSWVALGRRLTGVAWSPARASFRHDPLGDPREYEAFFTCPVQFGADANRLEIDDDVLSLAIEGARQELRPSLELFAQTLLDGVSDQGGYTRRLHEFLRRELPKGASTKHEAARALAISERTLTRRLREEGTSFREVLDRVRREFAEAWLSEPDNAIYEVAYLLGYTETSTFHRMFRRWTGQTPNEWRRRHTR